MPRIPGPVAIFAERIEIGNPGGLYGGPMIDKVREGCVFKAVSLLVAGLFLSINTVDASGARYDPHSCQGANRSAMGVG